ncbi:hypothetical protein D9757_002801 [Collybiopsis confluens]|uniref:Uncharacterized protein n=1 Tax=Collybiopsis confluens TaxID=2823264 RepID=A0A8H5HVE9_9AGAR|nr:hypothetical protein D9757_002801 [Collybiopsis confluens]
MSAHGSVQRLFPRATLALTNDPAIESILTDIPFFCVGLVAVFYFAFLLTQRRVTLLSIYIYSTALFSFGAAVLDLAQVLARGAANVNANTGITSSVTALINTREVGLSIAVGFRFLFFWAFVAERPRGEPPPTTDLSNPRAYKYDAKNSHSARWERWGFLGIFSKYVILVALSSIPILQIIWRIAVRHFGMVYMAESTIEILVSALFIMKIMLNIFLSPVSPWWKPLRFYLVPLLALLINLAVGIGELVVFLFSETSLGRFLQAFEVYMMILFILVVAFYKVPVRPMRPRTSFPSPYTVEEKQLRDTVLASYVDAEPITFDVLPSGVNDARTRYSTVSRVSSWILAPRQRREKPEDVEAGPKSAEITEELTAVPAGGQTSSDVRHSLAEKPVAPTSAAPPETSSTSLPTETQTLTRTSHSESRPSIGLSLRYYGVESRMSFPNPAFWGNDASSGTDSPVYGLNGFVNKRSHNRNSADSILSSNQRPSVSSFDELIEQQAELDRSIAALRLFSPPAPSIESAVAEDTSPNATFMPSVTAPSGNNRTISTLTSSSARSEFSLSIFPDPPAVDFSGTSRASFNTMRAKQRARPSRRDVPTSFDTGSADIPSVPSSPTRLVPGRQLDSNATQYDVTSFIGHLTSPSFSKIPAVGIPPSLDPVETSALGNIPSESEPEVKIEVPIISSADDSPGQERNIEEPTRKSSYPPLRPLFLGNVTTPSVSSPLAGNVLRAPIGPRRPARGRLALPSQPRLAISGPRVSARDNGIQASGAFESPRAVPTPLHRT